MAAFSGTLGSEKGLQQCLFGVGSADLHRDDRRGLWRRPRLLADAQRPQPAGRALRRLHLLRGLERLSGRGHRGDRLGRRRRSGRDAHSALAELPGHPAQLRELGREAMGGPRSAAPGLKRSM